MNFCQQTFSTLIGAFVAFVFGIALFYLTAYFKHSNYKKSILKNLKREFQFNLNLLDIWLKDINKTIEQVNSNDLYVYYFFNYGYFDSTFLREAFKYGLVYSKLEDEVIKNLADILRKFNPIGERIINEKIGKWQGGRIDQKEMLKDMRFERDILDQYKKQLRAIKNKFS